MLVRMLILVVGLFNTYTCEEVETTENITIDQAYEDIYDTLKLDEAEQKLKHYGFTGEMSLHKFVEIVKTGDTSKITRYISKLIKGYLFKDLGDFRGLMVEVMTVVLLGSVFIHLSISFGNGFVSENGFYVAYLIMTSILLAAFTMAMEMTSSALSHLILLVKILVPVYVLAMNYIGHTMTAAGMYEIITIGIFLVQIFILKFILPMIQFYVITSMVNNLNKEDTFSKLCKFIQSVIGWALKTIIVFIAGLNVIKSLIEPHMDELSKHAISKVIASVPGGGIVSVLTGTFLGAGVIIKNCIGIVGIVLIILLLLIPIAKTFLMMVTAKLTAALLQPIGEHRFVDGVEALANGMKLLLQAMGTSIVLFVLTIAIMAYASGGG